MRGEGAERYGPVDPPFLVEDRLAEPVEPESSAPLPFHRLRDPALLSVDNLLQSRDAVGDGVLPHLDADVPPSHLVRHGACGPGAEERVEDKITKVGGNVDNALN